MGMDAKQEVRNFLETSSIKGLPKILKSKGLTLRILWLIALFLGVGLAFLQIRIIIDTYFTYATSTKLEDSRGLRTTFPDVILCKTNPIVMPDVGNKRSGRISPLMYQGFIHYLTIGTGPNETDLIERLSKGDAYLETIKDGILERNASKRAIVVSCTLFSEPGMPFPCEDMIVEPIFLEPRKPNCLVLTGMSKNIRRMAKSLALIAFLDDFRSTFVPNFSVRDLYVPESAGVEVMISPEGTLPDFQTTIPVSPGHHAKILIKEKKYRREPAPYSDCIEDAKERYTKHACYQICLQKKLGEQCGCLHQKTYASGELQKQFPYCGSVQAGLLKLGLRDIGMNLTITDVVSLVFSLRVGQYHNAKDIKEKIEKCKRWAPHLSTLCGNLNGTDVLEFIREQLQCREKMSALIKRHCTSKCRPNCRETSYTQSVAAVEWPHVSYHLSFYHHIISNLPYANAFKAYESISRMKPSEVHAALEGKNLIKKNFLKISIMYDPYEPIISHHDIPVYDFLSMFGSASGILNLWVGLTFVTVVEVIDLVLRIGSGFLMGVQKKQNLVVEIKAPANDKRHSERIA